MMAPSLLIGSTGSGYLRVSPKLPPKGARDANDEGWIRADIEVRAGAFSGSIPALLRQVDFPSFREKLARLYDELSGTALLSTLEGWLTIKIEGDGKGHFVAHCEVLDDPSSPNRLLFELRFDQTDLPPMLRALAEISESLPGSPAA